MRGVLAPLVALLLQVAGAVAEPQRRPETFHGQDGMTGLFYAAPGDAARTGAVLIVHDALGMDQRSHRYIAQITAAGLAVLEVELRANPPDGLVPPLPGEAEAAALALRAAARLARDPRIDPARVGALGFGIGGRAVLLAAQAGPGGDPFAARMVLYPGCGTLRDRLRAAARIGGPVLLVAGESDPANDAAECEEVARDLQRSGDARLILYRGASYAWDLPQTGGGDTTGQPWPAGRGIVRSVAWPELAELTAAQAASFFADILRPPPAPLADPLCVSQGLRAVSRGCVRRD